MSTVPKPASTISGLTSGETTGSSGPGKTVSFSSSRSNNGQESNTLGQKKIIRFEGNTMALKGHVFEMSGGVTQYPRTLEQLQLYAAVQYNSTPEISSLFHKEPTKPTIKVPGSGPEGTGKDGAITTFDEKLFDEQVKAYFRKLEALDGNLQALFLVIVGQCDNVIKSHLQSLSKFDESQINGDCIWLLDEIRSVTSKFDKTHYIHDSLHFSLCRFYNLHQGNRSVTEYHNLFQEAIRRLEINNAWSDPPIAQNPSISKDTVAQTRKSIKQAQFACHFILNADNKRFAQLKHDLRAGFSRGTDQWPKTVDAAYRLLLTTESQLKDSDKQSNASASGSRSTSSRDTRLPSTKGSSYHQSQTTSTIPSTVVLIDTLATHSLFKTTEWLTNIRTAATPLELQTQAGLFKATQMADCCVLPGTSITVWYEPSAIANILAFRDVIPQCRITMDSIRDPAILVHCPEGQVVKFSPTEDGLYMAPSPANNHSSSSVNHYGSCSFIQSVQYQKQLFTQREIAAADAARTLYRKLGHPSPSLFEHCLRTGYLLNCPVTVEDAQRATLIYGPDVAYIKGRQTTHSPRPHISFQPPRPVPQEILRHHTDIVLCMDFFFVQGSCYIHSISRKLGFRHTEHVLSRSKSTILQFVQRVLKVYTSRGFNVHTIHADSEFACIQPDILPICIQSVTTNDHVPDIERSIRTMKEGLRTLIHGLPFRRLPLLMLHHLIRTVTFNLNRLPRGRDLLRVDSPACLVLGTPRPDFNQLHYEFGTYVQILDQSTNTMRARTIGAIVLDQSGAADGSYNFMSLRTGVKMVKHPASCTALPITDIAIRRVEQMAKEQKQPLIQNNHILIEWRPNQKFDPDEHDLDYQTEDDDSDSEGSTFSFDSEDEYIIDSSDSNEDDHVRLVTENNQHLDQDQHTPELSSNGPSDNVEIELNAAGLNDTNITVLRTNENNESETTNWQDVNHYEPDTNTLGSPQTIGATIDQPEQISETGATLEMGAQEEVSENTETQPTTSSEDGNIEMTDNENIETTETTTTTKSYNLRGNRGRSYNHRLISKMENSKSSKTYESGVNLLLKASDSNNTRPKRKKLMKTIAGILFAQMSARQGVKKHGENARAALRKEFAQLIHKMVYKAMKKEDLTPEQIRKALNAVNIIQEKRTGELKGRHCANGSKQKGWYDKGDTSSPTVSVDSLLLSFLIDAHEGRDVATADVVGAYLNATMEEFVLMRLTGDDVTLMCEVSPEFEKYVEMENNRRVLYLKMERALYGCVQSALLWYKLFSGTLKEMGFKLNPYDCCVANAVINGTQCTIAWYVDDNKISHLNPQVVTDIIEKIEKRFGTMKKTRGKKHEFLGMKISITEDGKVQICMRSYLEEALDECRMDIKRTATTPANNKLFEVDPFSSLLSQTDTESFRSINSKLLYVSLRGRPDLLTAVAFLSTRVASPTHQDQQKLKRVLEYIKGTLDLVLTIGADSLQSMRTFVDAAYGVHHDMKSHTGGTITFGTGTVLSRSSKQKLNTKSSTEAELVGASDYLAHTIWVQNFMSAQGYPIRENYFEQDNESAMKLEANGRASAGQRSRHINIRYFWITDRLKTDNITLRHCDTEAMLADFLTKPLQGSLFRRFRDVLLGYTHSSHLTQSSSSHMLERVGKHVKIVEPIVTDGLVADGQTWVESDKPRRISD